MKLLKWVYVIIKMATGMALLALAFEAFPFCFVQFGNPAAIGFLLLAIFWIVVFYAKAIKELKAI